MIICVAFRANDSSCASAGLTIGKQLLASFTLIADQEEGISTGDADNCIVFVFTINTKLSIWASNTSVVIQDILCLTFCADHCLVLFLAVDAVIRIICAWSTLVIIQDKVSVTREAVHRSPILLASIAL